MTFDLRIAPGGSATTLLSIPNNTGLYGLEVTGQAFSWSPLLTPLGAIASNGLIMTVGQQ